jgi:hypothetical protein
MRRTGRFTMMRAIRDAGSKRIIIAGLAALIAGGIGASQRLTADDQGRGGDQDRGNQGGGDDESRVKRGFEIAPVPLNLRGKNRALVGLGSYLVNAVGGCNDCHTNPPYALGGDPHLGQPKVVNGANYLAGGMAFGPFISRNITPDGTGKPAGLTREEFIHIIRTGEDDEPPIVPPGNDLLQVMPWPVYQDMSDRDLKAIYEYLTAIPHAEPALAP